MSGVMSDSERDGISEDRAAATTQTAATETSDGRVQDAGEGRKNRPGRLERLKAKARKLQGKNPDIYPMW
jgi:hypothetical protein